MPQHQTVREALQWSAILIALLGGLLLSGCENRQQSAPRPDPEVAVVTVRPQKLMLTTELPGRTSAYVIAEIRPQVNGIIQKRLFTEGSDVKAGQVLYQIDPAPFQAALNNATANLAVMRKSSDSARAALRASMAGVTRQRAVLELARTNRQRFEDASKDRAVSVIRRDQAITDANAAPLIPIFGKPNHPNISRGSRTIFKTVPPNMIIIALLGSPTPRSAV